MDILIRLPRHLSSRRRLRWPVLILALMLLSPGAAAAQDATEDWRTKLACPAEHQVHDGLLYCTGRDSTDSVVHVIVADLSSPDLRFEYILPKGASDGHTGVQECRDPNVPLWGGPAKGCYVPDNRSQYPRIKLTDAVKRAEEVRTSPAVAVVIDADYGAPNGTHGPEGLMVVRGERLDGAARCDDDFNAALRPWLGLGETVDADTGRIPAAINRLDSDSAPIPEWLYTGFGGGPWLVRDGEVHPSAKECLGERTLQAVDPVQNCTGNPKWATVPISECYLGGSCRTAPHTAAGLSADGRWLFLTMSTSASEPDVLAKFMAEQLHVDAALKFDGGGSSAFYFNGATPLYVDADTEDRPLSNWLAVYAGDGDGIRLPLEAVANERVLYQVVTPGETAKFTMVFTNTGPLTWFAEDGVALQGPGASAARGASKIEPALELTIPVPPGKNIEYTWTEDRTGVTFGHFQMAQHGKPFGQPVQTVVVGIPQSMADRKDAITETIKETVEAWKARGEEELDSLVQELQRRIKEELTVLTQNALEKLQEALAQICGGAGALLLIPVAALIRRRRRP